MDLQSAVDEYLLACAADGLAVATVNWYRAILKPLAVQFQGLELDAITASDARRYIVSLQNLTVRYANAPQKPPQPGGLSEASVNSHVRGLHSFFSWAAEEYDVPNPMKNIKRGRGYTPKPKAIAAADFIRLYEATSQRDAGIRDRAILVFLADTGCRLSGLLSLTLADLDLEHKRAVVTEKGEKRRAVVFTAYTARALAAWLDVRMSPVGYVFCSIITGQQLTDSGVNQILKRLKKRARVTGRVNPHSFRHNFAREYLRNGGDLATLARLLGHSDVSITAAYYAVFSEDELAALHDKFSPLNGLLELAGEG